MLTGVRSTCNRITEAFGSVRGNLWIGIIDTGPQRTPPPVGYHRSPKVRVGSQWLRPTRLSAARSRSRDPSGDMASFT